jgi:membrane-bound inhibitor of C-type lysozyme
MRDLTRARPDLKGFARLGRLRSGRWAGAVAFAALVCAGCGTPSTQGDYPADYPADSKSARPGELRMLYACRDGEQIEMRFLDTRGIALLSRRGRTLQLKQQSDASGNIYSDGRTTVRSKGRDLRLEMRGLEPIECRSQGSD